MISTKVRIRDLCSNGTETAMGMPLFVNM